MAGCVGAPGKLVLDFQKPRFWGGGLEILCFEEGFCLFISYMTAGE